MENRHDPVLMPSEVSSRVGPFDRFAAVSSKVALSCGWSGSATDSARIRKGSSVNLGRRSACFVLRSVRSSSSAVTSISSM